MRRLLVALCLSALLAVRAAAAVALTLNPTTGTLVVTRSTPIKVGSQVPVTVTFTTTPGTVSAMQLALGKAHNTPDAVLAYTEDFTQNVLVWSGTLDATDSRLVDYMAARAETPLSLELVTVIDGVRVIYPDIRIAVQPGVATEPTQSQALGSIVVHKTNGRTHSYSTLALAKAAAASGELVVVGPGGYTVTASLAKNGVNWDFAAGATATCTDPTVAIWDDGNTAMTFTVTGSGDFYHTCSLGGTQANPLSNQRAIYVRNASSRITIYCRDLICANTATPPTAEAPNVTFLWQEAGFVELHARDCSTKTPNDTVPAGSGYGAWWFNGEGHVYATRILSDYVYAAAEVNTTPTGDFHVTADYVENALLAQGLNPSAAIWVNVNISKDLTSGGGGVCSITGSNKVYLTAQKFFGMMLFTTNIDTPFNGLVYIKGDKHVPVANGDFDVTGVVGQIVMYTDGNPCTGTVFYDVTHVSPEAFTGDMLVWDSGTLVFGKTNYTANSNTKGWRLLGGSIKLKADCYINTAANSATDPVSIFGGSLTVEGRLISHASRKSIKNGNAGTYTVDAWGGKANRAADSGITANGLTVDNSIQ